MTDNAFAYAKNRSLRELLTAEGIKHLLTQPYRPHPHSSLGGRPPISRVHKLSALVDGNRTRMRRGGDVDLADACLGKLCAVLWHRNESEVAA